MNVQAKRVIYNFFMLKFLKALSVYSLDLKPFIIFTILTFLNMLAYLLAYPYLFNIIGVSFLEIFSENFVRKEVIFII